MKVCPVCQYEEEQDSETSCAICGSDLEVEQAPQAEDSVAEAPPAPPEMPPMDAPPAPPEVSAADLLLAPLRPAVNSVLLDTSYLDIEQAFNAIKRIFN